MADDAALRFEQIWKRYPGQTVLRGLCSEFTWGDRALLLGANGAGKSTLLRIAAGLARADSGAVTTTGTLGDVRLAASDLGYLGHEPQLYADLTPAENLALTARLRQIEVNVQGEAVALGFVDQLYQPVRELSRGQRSRVAIANALLHNPSIVLFDEPTAALDESALRALIARLEQLNLHHAGRTVALIATHDIRRLESWANRALVLRGGTIGVDSALQQSAPEIISIYLEATVLC